MQKPFPALRKIFNAQKTVQREQYPILLPFLTMNGSSKIYILFVSNFT
jgi:hypothetical protein